MKGVKLIMEALLKGAVATLSMFAAIWLVVRLYVCVTTEYPLYAAWLVWGSVSWVVFSILFMLHKMS